MELVSPLPPVENAANTDSWRWDSPPQSGHGAASSIRLIGLSLSKVFEHILQVYSYMGILLGHS